MADFTFPEDPWKNAALALKGFQRCPVWELNVRYNLSRFVPPRIDFPIPELVLFTMRDLLGFKWQGTEEKERWSVHAVFEKTILVFVMAKFGFEVEFTYTKDTELQAALRKLKKAIRYAEQGLKEFSSQQLCAGNVTIANRFEYFERRYRYFRHKAGEAYKLAERDRQKARERMRKRIGGIAPPDISVTRAGMDRDQEGSFCSAAMIDAFFSRLEHELVLILAFTDFSPGDNELTRVLGDKWGEKFKRVFDLKTDKTAHTIYQKLTQVKEQWRNPLAHGGYEKEWSSVHFHLPGIGPIPGSSPGYQKCAEFGLHPVEPKDHKTVCDVFDSVEKLLEDSHTKEAHEYIRHGFDVAFDEQSRKYIKERIQSVGIDYLIDAEGDLGGMDGDCELEVDDPDRLRFVSQPLTKFWR